MMFELADFKQYGIVWAQQWPDPPVNVTGIKDLLFPKMVACEIKRWGPTGLEDENGMCVLAPNVINQYIFLILWWSLVFVIVSNVFNVLAGIIRIVFIYGSYRRMLASAFLRDDPHYKKVYYKIGTSGRVILNVLAASISPTCFQEDHEQRVSASHPRARVQERPEPRRRPPLVVWNPPGKNSAWLRMLKCLTS